MKGVTERAFVASYDIYLHDNGSEKIPRKLDSFLIMYNNHREAIDGEIVVKFLYLDMKTR